MNGGIIFFKTLMLEELVKFYIEEVGCELWLKQDGCQILKFNNLLFGFCQCEKSEVNGIITFVYDTPAEVDTVFEKFKSSADAKPRINSQYDIYQFFSVDPEGRTLEFQYFLNEPNEK